LVVAVAVLLIKLMLHRVALVAVAAQMIDLQQTMRYQRALLVLRVKEMPAAQAEAETFM
jgi:hypothetical protein